MPKPTPSTPPNTTMMTPKMSAPRKAAPAHAGHRNRRRPPGAGRTAGRAGGRIEAYGSGAGVEGAHRRRRGPVHAHGPRPETAAAASGATQRRLPGGRAPERGTGRDGSPGRAGRRRPPIQPESGFQIRDVTRTGLLRLLQGRPPWFVLRGGCGRAGRMITAGEPYCQARSGHATRGFAESFSRDCEPSRSVGARLDRHRGSARWPRRRLGKVHESGSPRRRAASSKTISPEAADDLGSPGQLELQTARNAGGRWAR